MTHKRQTDSEEVWNCQFITNDETDPPTVRYNKLAYERKLERQAAEEKQAQPLTQRAVTPAPITQRAIPKR